MTAPKSSPREAPMLSQAFSHELRSRSAVCMAMW